MSTAKLSVLREEAKRKAIHLCGIAIPVLYLFFQRELLILGLLLAFLLAGSIEWLRFRGLIALPCLREKEQQKIGGYVFFLTGAFISIILFEKSIAIVAILMLAIGDAVSALAGAVVNENNLELYVKRTKPPEVMAVMFVTSFLISYLILHSLPVAVCGAIGATIADGVPLRISGISIDDNLTIPLFAGLLMSILRI